MFTNFNTVSTPPAPISFCVCFYCEGQGTHADGTVCKKCHGTYIVEDDGMLVTFLTSDLKSAS